MKIWKMASALIYNAENALFNKKIISKHMNHEDRDVTALSFDFSELNDLNENNPYKNELSKTAREDIDNFMQFTKEAFASKGKSVTYEAICRYTGSSIITVKRAASSGKIKKINKTSRPALIDPYSVFIWKYGDISLPANPFEREKELLWRALLKKGVSGIPIPDSLNKLMDYFTAPELKIIRANIDYANHENEKFNSESPEFEEYMNIYLAICDLCKKGNQSDKTHEYITRIFPVENTCPNCLNFSVEFKGSHKRIKNNEVEFNEKLVALIYTVIKEYLSENNYDIQRDFIVFMKDKILDEIIPQAKEKDILNILKKNYHSWEDEFSKIVNNEISHLSSENGINQIFERKHKCNKCSTIINKSDMIKIKRDAKKFFFQKIKPLLDESYAIDENGNDRLTDDNYRLAFAYFKSSKKIKKSDIAEYLLTRGEILKYGKAKAKRIKTSNFISAIKKASKRHGSLELLNKKYSKIHVIAGYIAKSSGAMYAFPKTFLTYIDLLAKKQLNKS